MKLFVLAALISSVCVLPLAASQAKAKTNSVEYELTELPLRALAISNSGWIAGATEDQKAVRWSAAHGLEHITLPAEFTVSEALGINSSGETIGWASTTDSTKRAAFVLLGNKVQLLPGEQASAYGINEAGEIVGQARLARQTAVGAVVWASDSAGNFSAQDLKICCAGTAKSINGSGVIAGDVYDNAGRYHAFVRYATKTVQRIEDSIEQFSSTAALNDRGQILVRVTPGSLRLYTGEKFEAIEIAEVTAHGINHDAIIVGSIGSNPEEQRAFIWDKTHGARDLNSLIPANFGWTLEVATAINDRGEIVGWGDRNGEENSGFLLRPISKQTAPAAKPLPKTESKSSASSPAR